MNDVSLELLKEMNPNYIKIESDYLQDMENRSHTEMALNAILTITDSLGIELIATRIETEAQRQALVAKNITCFQGHGIAGIGPLEG
jgi:EAL domain-containing protein (putative c-di-GMP-specific phosphodiesterase class I)